MRWTLVLVLAGCAAPLHMDPGVPASTHLDAATEVAAAWSSEARLGAVFTYEADWSEAASASRMTQTYNVTDPVVGDGLALRWSYVFLREGLLGNVQYVIHMDATGRVLSAYESQRPDDGAIATSVLGPWTVDSVAAVEAAAHSGAFAKVQAQADRGALFLVEDDGPVWRVMVQGPSASHEVRVDATSGRLVG